MTMGDRGWRDSTENYCDYWSLTIVGSTATAISGQGLQAIALVGGSITVNPGTASGSIQILDSSATANADPVVATFNISTGTQSYVLPLTFARPVALNNGLVVTAATVTGSINLVYKVRY